MIEGKGYLRPNVQKIKKILADRQWNEDKLAEESGLDARIIPGVLRGEKKQWGKMKAIADALGVQLGQIVDGLTESEDVWPAYSDLKIYKDWEPAWPAIESANESVLIIDSIFSNEAGRLGPALAKHASQREGPLNVSVFMASTNTPFGAQRIRERDLPAKELLAQKTSGQDEKEYTTLFGKVVKAIRTNSKIEIPIFEYACMPSLRIIRVDDVHFYWGWYPLEGQNPNHVCIYVNSIGNNVADKEMCDRLSDHVGKVIERSIPVP